jgi:hypothetical protein
MSTKETSPDEAAIRAAELLSMVMNLTAVLHHAPALEASDPAELRSSLLWVVDEMTWLASQVVRGLIGGVSWPPDAQQRIEHLRDVAGAWDPVDPPPPEVLDAARGCLGILQPT